MQRINQTQKQTGEKAPYLPRKKQESRRLITDYTTSSSPPHTSLEADQSWGRALEEIETSSIL
jgi:hypothetical protein